MGDVPGTLGPYRLACIFSQNPSNPSAVPKSCRTGEVNMSHFREHMKKKHVCNCASSCRKSMHFPAHIIDGILDVRKKDGEPDGLVWTKIYRRAHPDAVHVPPPYLPSVDQSLAVARNPPPHFRKLLVLAFAGHDNPNLSQAVQDVDTVIRNLPVYYDVLSRVGPSPTSDVVPHGTAVSDPASSSASPGKERLQIPTPASSTRTTSPGLGDSGAGSCIVNEEIIAYWEHLNCLENEWEIYFS